MTKCPTDGLELELTEYPDTGTSVDFYEGTCPNGHKWEVQVENQTGEVSLKELPTRHTIPCPEDCCPKPCVCDDCPECDTEA